MPASAALLNLKEMYDADRLTIESGTPGFALMQAAGGGIARIIKEKWVRQPVLVLAGPGNNGGDGFIVARDLAAEGWPVRVALLGSPQKLKGDAAIAHREWDGPVEKAAAAALGDESLIVDALFGAGLDRPLQGEVAALVDAVNDSDASVVAVDMPSGIHGDTGAVMGTALRADLTVTFFRKKQGHTLMPGRRYAGDIRVIDIGIPDSVLERLQPDCFENSPALWRDHFPVPDPEGHKYDRGHAVVMSGGEGATGAARLAARGALRAGAGLVTVVCPPDALAVNAAHLTAVMTHAVADVAAFEAYIADDRRNAVLLGPGNGVTEATRHNVLAAARQEKKLILDADALTVFADDRETLFDALPAETVLTPHMGEFKRLFPDAMAAESKIAQAQTAARTSGAVVLLKGPDTVVAAPDGRTSVTTNAPPTLATAGAGDTLAGFILGLMAQGMPAFEAASAAAWLQGEAARLFGPGLISEDLSDMLPAVLRGLADGDYGETIHQPL